MKIVDKSFVPYGNKTVRIWNLKDGSLLHELKLPGQCNNFDLNSERTLLAVAHNKGVSIWNFRNLIQISEIELNIANDVRFNEPGTILIIDQRNGQVSKVTLDFSSRRTTVPTILSATKRPFPTSFW